MTSELRSARTIQNVPEGTPYTVTLTVSDGTSSVSQSEEILIANLAPTANAGPSVTIQEGMVVTLGGQGSDPGPGNDYTIEWDFDFQTGTFTADASGTLSPTHVYNSAGPFAVALRITDLTGAASLSFTSVDVQPASSVMSMPGPTAMFP